MSTNSIPETQENTTATFQASEQPLRHSQSINGIVLLLESGTEPNQFVLNFQYPLSTGGAMTFHSFCFTLPVGSTVNCCEITPIPHPSVPGAEYTVNGKFELTIKATGVNEICITGTIGLEYVIGDLTLSLSHPLPLPIGS